MGLMIAAIIILFFGMMVAFSGDNITIGFNNKVENKININTDDNELVK